MTTLLDFTKSKDPTGALAAVVERSSVAAARQRSEKRKPIAAEVFTREGDEVLITLTCPHCQATKPLRAFGLRRMGNGQIRNCPWCKTCRANPGVRIEVVVGAPA